MSFLGDVRILYIKESGVFIPVACLTNNSLDETTEMLSTTTLDNNGWETSVPGMQSFSIAFDALVEATAGDTTRISYDKLKMLKRAGTRIEWKIADSGGNFVDTGFGYIVDIGEAAPAGDFLTFSCFMQGYGEPIFATGILYQFQDETNYEFQDGTQFEFN